MASMPIRWARAALLSMLSLASTTWPLRSCTNRSRIGVSIRQGPHHGAQKSTSTSTSCDRCTTACSRLASFTPRTHGELDVLIPQLYLKEGSCRATGTSAVPTYRYDIGELFGVRWLDAALDDLASPPIQSGVEPPHSKNRRGVLDS